MELVISFIIKTENREYFVVLLFITDVEYNNGLACSGINLHVGSSRHKTLSSKLKSGRLAAHTLCEHNRLRGEHYVTKSTTVVNKNC